MIEICRDISEVEERLLRDERWGVEIAVLGFGPNHRLWLRFTEGAMARGESTFQWVFSQTAERTGETPRIRAVARAQSAEAAMKHVMRAIREVGHSIDRYGEVNWTEMEGTAYRL